MLDLVMFHKNISKPPQSWTTIVERIREGNLRYKCTTCGFKCKPYKSFVNHALDHTGERPYKCRVAGCDNAFRNWKNLETHLADHYDERSFVCDTCGNAYKHKHAYLAHIYDVHVRKKYKSRKQKER